MTTRGGRGDTAHRRRESQLEGRGGPLEGRLDRATNRSESGWGKGEASEVTVLGREEDAYCGDSFG